MNQRDEITRTVVGTTWSELETMLKNGYVPTLRPHSGRDKGTRKYNEAVNQLAGEVEKAGYRVYRGR